MDKEKCKHDPLLPSSWTGNYYCARCGAEFEVKQISEGEDE